MQTNTDIFCLEPETLYLYIDIDIPTDPSIGYKNFDPETKY